MLSISDCVDLVGDISGIKGLNLNSSLLGTPRFINHSEIIKSRSSKSGRDAEEEEDGGDLSRTC